MNEVYPEKHSNPDQISNSRLLGVFPEEIRVMILAQLDLGTFLKASRVSKEWQRLLQTDSLWKDVYYHSQNQAALFNGELWHYIFQEAQDSDSTVEDVLCFYFRKFLKIDMYIGKGFNILVDLLASFSQEGFKGLSNNEDLTACQQYIGSWTAEKLHNEVNQLLLQCKQWKNILEFGIADYRNAIIALTKIQKIEQIFAVLIVARVIAYSLRKQKDVNTAILEYPLSHLVTAKGLLAISEHFPHVILSCPLFTERLSDKQLIKVVKSYCVWLCKPNVPRIDKVGFHEIAGANSALIERFIKNTELLYTFIKIDPHNIFPIQMMRVAVLRDKLPMEIILDFSIRSRIVAYDLLESDSFSHRWELEHLNKLRAYVEYLDNLRNFHSHFIESMLIKRQSEWVQRQKPVLMRKSTNELLEYAVNPNLLAQIAAECLVENEAHLKQLTFIALEFISIQFNDNPNVLNQFYRYLRIQPQEEQEARKGNIDALKALEQLAVQHLNEGRVNCYDWLALILCEGYVCRGNIAEATDWYISMRNYVPREGGNQLPFLVRRLITNLRSLPNNHQFICETSEDLNKCSSEEGSVHQQNNKKPHKVEKHLQIKPHLGNENSEEASKLSRPRNSANNFFSSASSLPSSYYGINSSLTKQEEASQVSYTFSSQKAHNIEVSNNNNHNNHVIQLQNFLDKNELEKAWEEYKKETYAISNKCHSVYKKAIESNSDKERYNIINNYVLDSFSDRSFAKFLRRRHSNAFFKPQNDNKANANNTTHSKEVTLVDMEKIMIQYRELKKSKKISHTSIETLCAYEQASKMNITDEMRFEILQKYMQDESNHHRDFYETVVFYFVTNKIGNDIEATRSFNL